MSAVTGVGGRFPADHEEALAALGRVVHVRAGRALFHEGDVGRSVFLVRHGHVFVVAAGVEGQEAIVGVRGPGELVDELAGMLGRRRTATVRAATDVAAIEVRADTFETYLRDHGDALMAVVSALAGQLLAANRAMAVASASVIVRIARRLLELAVEAPDGTTAEVPLQLSQDELAAWVGTTRESVAKALRQLRADGIVSTARRSIVVHDLAGLRAAALAFGAS